MMTLLVATEDDDDIDFLDDDTDEEDTLAADIENLEQPLPTLPTQKSMIR
mgnify:CR=1 FL=1